jgi:cell wall assembly regulator SMI1
MNDLLIQEFDQLQELFHSANRPFPKNDGATDVDLKRVYQKTGINFTGGIVDFYKLLNGSDQEHIFAVFSDEPTACKFNSIETALFAWGAVRPNVDAYYLKMQSAWNGYVQDPPRDIRIKPNLWVNKLWYPMGDFNGGATILYWDADPAPAGRVGQIIVYQHSPDAYYYVAPDFETFLIKSNNLFTEYRRELLERFYE